MRPLDTVVALHDRAVDGLRALGHLVDLAIRFEVAQAFFRSGLVKVGNWDGTLHLFQNEYRVPLLAPELAAWLGTFGELCLPPLLALGLATRFAALSLTAFNIVAVISFWHVLRDNEAALNSHLYWGLLLLVTLTHGPGKLSLDHLMRRMLRTRGAGDTHLGLRSPT